MSATGEIVKVSEPVLQRVGALAEQYALDQAVVAKYSKLLSMLAADRYAATAQRDPQTAADTHIADSLTALEISEVTSARRTVDIGAGAGFPGLVLAVAIPQCQFDLVESSKQKLDFPARVVKKLCLGNVSPLAVRAEDWAAGEGRCGYDVALARAVGPLALVLEYAAPLLAVGGSLVAWKGKVGKEEFDAALSAAVELRMEPGTIIQTEPYRGSRGHRLYTFRKVGPTPDRFPRKPGVARKRQLGKKKESKVR